PVDPEPTPEVPEEVTPVDPEPTPEVPEEVTPVDPEPTPEVPEVTPVDPEPTPEVPEVTPVDPEPTPEVPEVTPTDPEPTPEVPEVTPVEPEPTPEIPEVTPVEPELKPENPLSYKNEADVLRRYDMGNDITYYVMKHEKASDYEVQITIKDELVGGYYAVNGGTLYNQMIGTKNPATVTHNTFKLTPLIDTLDGNKLLGISYELKNYANQTKLREAMQLHTSENLLQVSQVYADLATQFRAQHGKTALVAHDVLTKAAKNHSMDMAMNNYFEHTSKNGSKAKDRVAAVGNVAWLKIGENIAAGRSSIFEAHVGWINSEGHRKNLLDGEYTHVGYGVDYNAASDYDLYHTTVFVKLKK
ncbi:MAG: CAP domain-containing protein, partial [Caryophanon sp.]|nr:CAP domain-containing protein [Caryophanon sp.]